EERESAEKTVGNVQQPGFYSNNGTSLLYGWNDLSNYGEWSVFPVYGTVWVPHVSPSWGPFRSGRWCWYPNLGYTWISAEPWGWVPYHYGQWIFMANSGWGWVPGNLSTWSPALVTWIQGPGWIGWA